MVKVLLCVSAGDEAGLLLQGREINSLSKELLEQGFVVGDEEREHRADLLDIAAGAERL